MFLADQILTGVDINGSATGDIRVGMGVTQSIPTGTVVAGIGTAEAIEGYFKGIITGVSTDASGSASSVDVKVVLKCGTTARAT